MRRILLVIILFSLCAAQVTLSKHIPAPESPNPQPQSLVPQMLRLQWFAAPSMLQGMQDNAGGIIHRHLVMTGGFCGGADNDRKPGIHTRGFLDKTWALSLDNPEQGWKLLPPLPGEPRQMMYFATVNDAVYVWGGFSYSPPYTYDDGYRLCRKDGKWVWQALPKLPYGGVAGGTCASGTKIYLFGGMDYDGTSKSRYGTSSKIKRTCKPHPRFKDITYHNQIMVYDIRTNLYGKATPLPFDDHVPPSFVLEDTYYLFPGETAGFVWNGEYFGHHPELVLKGKIKECQRQR